jgi:hypothetical protein
LSIELITAAPNGPQEGGITVLAAAASTDYTVDLQQYGALGITPLSVHTSAGTLYYKFSNDANATISTVAVAGAPRAMSIAAANAPLDVIPPQGYRYLILQSSAIATIRIHARSSFRAPGSLELLHLFAEGDSNTAIDAPALATAYGGPSNKWWQQLQRLFAARSLNGRFVANVAQSGSQWTVGSGLAPNPIISATRQNALDALANANTLPVCFIETSTNDINSLGDVLLTLQTNMRQWCDNRLAAGKGWQIVPMAIPPQTLSAGKNAIITAYNAWLPDLIGEGRAVAVVGRPTILDNSQNTTYYAPNSNIGVAEHWNDAGAAVMAQEAFRVLANVTWPVRP